MESLQGSIRHLSILKAHWMVPELTTASLSRGEGTRSIVRSVVGRINRET